MIKELTINDVNNFSKLGNLVNSNFDNVYKLNEIIESSYDKVIGYYLEEKLVGFIHIRVLYETIEIINIVVDTQYRRKGVATLLMEFVVKNINNIKEILLEVNENNEAAISVYKKNNFNVISERKNYYGNDTALIMKRDV